jgi:hypothetical protein
MGSKRLRKSDIRDLLERRDYDALLAWAGSVRNPMRFLTGLTFDPDELIRWRAIDAVGRVAGMLAKENPERVRDIIRRILWLMNDESGGLAWHGPEMIGEILVHVPLLIPEYTEILPSYLCEEPFERGTRFAMYRVAQVDPHAFGKRAADLRSSLDDPDPLIRAYGILALHATGQAGSEPEIAQAARDVEAFPLYDFDTGELGVTTLAKEIGSG